MTWQNHGIIYLPDGKLSWAASKCRVPSCHSAGKWIRVYYATRNSNAKSLTSFIEVSTDYPTQLLYVHDQPVLDFGKPGTHDEDGVMTGCVLKVDDKFFLYYTGWSRCLTVPYRVSTGLAISTDGGITFERFSRSPHIEQNKPRTLHDYVSLCVT